MSEISSKASTIELLIELGLVEPNSDRLKRYLPWLNATVNQDAEKTIEIPV